MPALTSVQLFTVKDALESDLDGTLAEVARRGFTAVEPYDFVRRAAPLAASLTTHGLTAPTGHAFLASESFVNPDGSGTTLPVPTPDEVFDAADVLGMGTVIDPYTEPARWETRAQVEETARLLNAAAEIAAARGLRVGYHNHAHELEAQFDGQSGLELLAELLDPRVVLEVDLYWAARAGVDPAALLERLGDRVVAVHVKDGTLDAEAIKAYPPADQVPAGTGAVPLAAALDAASALEFAIVEFDAYSGDLFEGIEQSRVFLDERAAR
ncbi:sugar phosphate isomerase/epimerase [Microbacterium sp. CFBP9034]|uniref:sugar phosphate isomerase/epimerase family protein n=1 Tax=Microbacterium sp. CFBP9034 TaxID=3096540 RepID=UPI002A69EAD8|nr:sugar phosphate isomerase/epimerase [Microbacterium sp. CFBP9034]MDY0910220.1 sugar phosphate isomerase/epimerase [Microbacterium sp. CFBP9034]